MAVVAKILIQNATNLGIDLNTIDIDGLTGFHYACDRGDSDIIKIFMENPASLNIVSMKNSNIPGQVSIWQAKKVILVWLMFSWRMLSFETYFYLKKYN